MPEHLVCVAGELHGLWRTRDEFLCPAVVLALGLGEGYFAGIFVPEFYLENAWNAVKYLFENYPEVFVGVGIPYNKALISTEELLEIGKRIAGISEKVQVCVLDYRPAFRRDLEPPTVQEMKKIKEILEGTGLRNVIAQTSNGHTGP